MSNLHLIVTSVNGENRIDSRLVAGPLGIEHKAFLETLRKYQDKLELLGQLPFETAVGYREQGGGNPSKYVMLNENQSIFASTLSRNTEQVVEFKLKLTQAFAAARCYSVNSNSLNIDLGHLDEIIDRLKEIKKLSKLPKRPETITEGVLRIVAKLEDTTGKPPTSNQVKDYLKRWTCSEIRWEMARLAQIGQLGSYKTNRTTKYFLSL